MRIRPQLRGWIAILFNVNSFWLIRDDCWFVSWALKVEGELSKAHHCLRSQIGKFEYCKCWAWTQLAWPAAQSLVCLSLFPWRLFSPWLQRIGPVMKGLQGQQCWQAAFPWQPPVVDKLPSCTCLVKRPFVQSLLDEAPRASCMLNGQEADAKEPITLASKKMFCHLPNKLDRVSV